MPVAPLGEDEFERPEKQDEFQMPLTKTEKSEVTVDDKAVSEKQDECQMSRTETEKSEVTGDDTVVSEKQDEFQVPQTETEKSEVTVDDKAVSEKQDECQMPLIETEKSEVTVDDTAVSEICDFSFNHGKEVEFQLRQTKTEKSEVTVYGTTVSEICDFSFTQEKQDEFQMPLTETEISKVTVDDTAVSEICDLPFTQEKQDEFQMPLTETEKSEVTVDDADVPEKQDEFQVPLNETEKSEVSVEDSDVPEICDFSFTQEKQEKFQVPLTESEKFGVTVDDADVREKQDEFQVPLNETEKSEVSVEDSDVPEIFDFTFTEENQDEFQMPLTETEKPVVTADDTVVPECLSLEEDLMKKLVLAKAEIYETEYPGSTGQSKAESMPPPELLSNLGGFFEFDMMSLRAKRTTITESSYNIDPSVASFIKTTKNKKRKRATHMAQLAKLPPVPPKAIGDRNLHTLVLDLDQTLINVISCQTGGCITLPRETGPLFVRLRPYVFQFLHAVKDLYEVIVFTAGIGSGSDTILKYLDPDNQIFRHKLYRDHCCYSKSKTLRTKDLRVLKRDMATIVMVDNNPKNFVYQPDNCLPIKSFYEDMNDTELEVILPVLIDLSKVKDVRPKLKELYGINKLFSKTDVVCETHTFSSSI